MHYSTIFKFFSLGLILGSIIGQTQFQSVIVVGIIFMFAGLMTESESTKKETKNVQTN